MNAFHRGLMAVTVLVLVGVGLVVVFCLDGRGRTQSSGQSKADESGAVNASTLRPQTSARGGSREADSASAADGHAAVSVRRERVVSDSGTSRTVEPGGAVVSASGERVARFTDFDQEEFSKRSTELSAVGDLACQGDAVSIRTLVAVADSGTTLSGEAVRMIGRVPAKSPEVVERLIRYAQTPDFRVSSAALEVLPQIATESRALAVVSNVLASCHDREYGSTNKVGPVCMYVGRNKIREACIGVLASFRSAASLTIVEQELGATERTAEKEYGQQEYGVRLAALLNDMRSTRPVPVPP